MSTEAIKKFLREAYSDEKLAALKAHTEDGKLSFTSCCCFVGIPTADHALCGMNEVSIGPHYLTGTELAKKITGYFGVFQIPNAEHEFFCLGSNDSERRTGLLPLINEEIAYRDSLKSESSAVLEEVEDCA